MSQQLFLLLIPACSVTYLSHIVEQTKQQPSRIYLCKYFYILIFNE